MGLVDEAIENLEGHGIDVERPTNVRKQDEVNISSEAANRNGDGQGLEAASYRSLNDRIDVYMPLGILKAIRKLPEQEREKANRLVEENGSKFPESIARIRSESEGPLASKSLQQTELARLKYKVVKSDLNNDEELERGITENLRDTVLYDLEHELIHASHYQEILEQDVEPIDTHFEDYIRDVENLGEEELGELDRKRLSQGVQNVSDLEFSVAVDFLKDNGYGNLVDIAEEEYSKWSGKSQEITEEIREREEEIKKPVLERLDDWEAEFAYGEITDIAKTGVIGRPEELSIEEAIEAMKEEEIDEYQLLKDSVEDMETVERSLKQLDRLYNGELEEEKKEYDMNAFETRECLKNAILEQTGMEEDFEQYLEPYLHRMEESREVPTEFTEALAQFWTGYREDNLDSQEGREQMYQKLEGYGTEGLKDTVNELFQDYDSLEGSTEEKVTEIMSQQFDYLEEQDVSGSPRPQRSARNSAKAD